MDLLLECVWRPVDRSGLPKSPTKGKSLGGNKQGKHDKLATSKPPKTMLEAVREAEDEESTLASKATAPGDAPVSASEDVKVLFTKRAWGLSINPIKAHGPGIFMTYMMGGNGIFGLVFLGFTMITAIKTLVMVNKVFDDFERSSKVKGNTTLQRAAYVLFSLVFIAYFTYRAASIGILPVGDIRSHLPVRNNTPGNWPRYLGDQATAAATR